jgi:hypothetical protein
MSKKTSYHKGTIEKYRSSLKDCITNKESFTTITSGMSRRIVLPNGVSMKYFGSQKNSSLIDGAFLVPMVQREIDQYIELYGIPKHNEVADVQLFNIPNIERAIKKQHPVLGIDINACYWNTAYHLGYISKELYERGVKKVKKQGLLISIGCLNKKPIIKTYDEGKLVSSYHDEETYNRYSPFYWNIIEVTHKIMVESYSLFKDNWYMFLTDCLFVDFEVAKDAKKFINSFNYEVKSHQIVFEKFDGRRLTWFDFKDHKEKQIHALGRDIELISNLDKISKGIQ